MNADGVVCTKECTGVLPWYNDKGKTDEEKGATRYLGVYLSFAGWQVQQEKLYKMAKSFYLETAWTKPSFRQMHALVQSLLVSRASYARHVMPVDNDITNYYRSQITTTVMSILGVRGYDQGNSALAALLFTPPDIGLGMGMPDPTVAGYVLDTRRLVDGFETADERQAAAQWAALPEAIDNHGRVRADNGSFNTVTGRLATIGRLGIWAHAGGSNGSIKYAVQHDHVTKEELPERWIGNPKRPKAHQVDNSRLLAEAQIALVPPSVLYIPGNHSAPPMGTFTKDKPLRGSYDPLGAVGMAAELGLTTVWAFDYGDPEGIALDAREWSEVTQTILQEIDRSLNESASNDQPEAIEQSTLLRQLADRRYAHTTEQEALKELKTLTSKGVLEAEVGEDDGSLRYYTKGKHYQAAWEIFRSTEFLSRTIAARAATIAHEAQYLARQAEEADEDASGALDLDPFVEERKGQFEELDTKARELKKLLEARDDYPRCPNDPLDETNARSWVTWLNETAKHAQATLAREHSSDEQDPKTLNKTAVKDNTCRRSYDFRIPSQRKLLALNESENTFHLARQEVWITGNVTESNFWQGAEEREKRKRPAQAEGNDEVVATPARECLSLCASSLTWTKRKDKGKQREESPPDDENSAAEGEEEAPADEEQTLAQNIWQSLLPTSPNALRKWAEQCRIAIALHRSRKDQGGLGRREAELKSILNTWGLEAEDVEGDNNCMFTALAIQLKRVQRFNGSPKELRKSIVEWMYDHGNLSIGGEPQGGPSTLSQFVEGTWQEYLTKMVVHGGEWGDHCVLLSAAIMFKVRIHIFSTLHSNEPLTIEAPPGTLTGRSEPLEEGDVQTVCLGHYPEIHYISTRPAVFSQEDESAGDDDREELASMAEASHVEIDGQGDEDEETHREEPSVHANGMTDETQEQPPLPRAVDESHETDDGAADDIRVTSTSTNGTADKGMPFEFKAYSKLGQFVTLATAVRDHLEAKSLTTVALFAERIIKAMKGASRELWPGTSRYVITTDASCKTPWLPDRATKKHWAEIRRIHGVKAPEKPSASTALAKHMAEERRSIHQQLQDGKEVYAWVYFHDGWQRWTEPSRQYNASGQKSRLRIEVTDWQLVRMHKRKDNDVRGNMVVQWSELVDPKEAKTTGRLDVVPMDVTATNSTPLNTLDLLQTHEPQHDEYYVETWEKFQKRLYYGAQKPGKVGKLKRWALKDLIVPPVNPLGLMKAAAACAKQKLQLPTLDLCAFLHATHVHPKQVAQMAKTEEVNMRLVGRHMFEAAKIILQMDSEGALPALSDPMAPYGAQVCCGCLCPKETHEARVEACRGAQATGLHGAPYGNTSNLYSVKKDAKKKKKQKQKGQQTFPLSLLRSAS